MDPNLILGEQQEEEWKKYQAIYKQCFTESGIAHWLDIRGNHGKASHE